MLTALATLAVLTVVGRSSVRVCVEGEMWTLKRVVAPRSDQSVVGGACVCARGGAR